RWPPDQRENPIERALHPVVVNAVDGATIIRCLVRLPDDSRRRELVSAGRLRDEDGLGAQAPGPAHEDSEPFGVRVQPRLQETVVVLTRRTGPLQRRELDSLMTEAGSRRLEHPSRRPHEIP